MATDLVSTEPATGREIWHGQSGNVDETVERARVAMRSWAREPLGRRIELMRRFANQVRKHSETFAELIARETGKPLWEARTEVQAVIGKVEISVTAYAERTGQKKLNSALQGTAALRHKPHGVMAVLGPYNFPAHLPNGHIIPALIAGNVVIFKPSEKTPAVGEFLTRCFHEAKVPEDVIQCIHGGVERGRVEALGDERLKRVRFDARALAHLRQRLADDFVLMMRDFFCRYDAFQVQLDLGEMLPIVAELEPDVRVNVAVAERRRVREFVLQPATE